MKLSIQENSSEFYDNLQLEDIPETLPPQVNLIRKGGKYGFKVGNIVGIIPLKNDTHLSIEPKYTGLNILEMILYIEGIESKFSNSNSTNFLELGNTNALNKFFLDKFVRELIVINSHSLKFMRQKVKENHNSIQGTVNWKNTKLNIKKKRNNPVETKVFKSNYAIPENIIL